MTMTSVPPGHTPVATIRDLVLNSAARVSEDATVRCRIERSAAGATVISDAGARAHHDETTSDRIELDTCRVDPGSLQAFSALFSRFFLAHPGARAGRVHAFVRGRVVPGAFGFGHLAISRPVFQATEIRPENDMADPV
jgi:hypothetical protein